MIGKEDFETLGPYLSSRVLIQDVDMKSSQLRIETTKNYLCRVVFSSLFAQFNTTAISTLQLLARSEFLVHQRRRN